ncbi:dephospho-CoA kinase [Zavarzinia sp. CC-PAN008]|uniref:dephospho-CoA kinase n=1 Tax=Zavarzinia sp. CC-PAN008 TaxID=3243332 RepID=UPI003F7497CB
MLKIGLTGSIGMGKSETAKMFARLGVPVYDADAAVHALYAKGGKAVGPLGEAFPGVVVDDAVDRAALSRAIAGQPEQWKKLEAIVHVLVGESQRAFLDKAKAEGHKLVVLDIPLLFETKGEGRVDRIVVVSAPADLQKERVLARPGMTEEKLVEILARQTPDAHKRERAHFVVETHRGLDDAHAQVEAIVAALHQELDEVAARA